MSKGNKNGKMRLPRFAATLAMAAGAATIDVKGVIGMDADATAFIDLVNEAKEAGCTDLTVRINSMGGSCYEGLAMCDCLKNCGMHTTGIVIGTAQSMASFLLQCCDERKAHENATLMFHQPTSGAFGTVDELAAKAKYLCEMRDKMFAIMGARCGMSGEDLSKEHMSMKLYTAQQAKEKGFLDTIMGGDDAKNLPAALPLPKMDGELCTGGNLPYEAARLAFAMLGDDDDDEGEEGGDKSAPAPKEGDKPAPAPKPGTPAPKPGTPAPKPGESDGKPKPDEKPEPKAQGLTRDDVLSMFAEERERIKADVIASMGLDPASLPKPANTGDADGTPPEGPEPSMEELDAMPSLLRMQVLRTRPELAAKYAKH